MSYECPWDYSPSKSHNEQCYNKHEESPLIGKPPVIVKYKGIHHKYRDKYTPSLSVVLPLSTNEDLPATEKTNSQKKSREILTLAVMPTIPPS